MKAKGNSIFAATICAIYVLAVLFFVLSLALEHKSGSERSKKRFNSITNDLTRISKNYAPQTQKFYDEFLFSLGNVADIAGIQIKYDEQLIFSYPNKLSELEKIKPSLAHVFSTTVFAENGIPLTLTASIYLLKPSSIFYRGLASLAAVLLATLATVLYLIFFVKRGDFPKEKEAAEADEIVSQKVEEETSVDLTEDDSPFPSDDEGDTSDQIAEPLAEAKISQNDENADSSPLPPAVGDQTDAADNVPDAQPLPAMETLPPLEASDEDVLSFLDEKPSSDTQPLDDTDSTGETENWSEETGGEPQGLFCPDTGFGWEEYMLTRLEAELVRAASGDQDLSLFTIRVKGVNWRSACGNEVARKILEAVKFNDLVFNNKHDGATAIFLNQNTDKSLLIAGELQNAVNSIIKKHGQQGHLSCAIGISSRSLRLISSSRLVNESEEALNRTDADSPVIAFKVNPERYKNFLATGGTSDETTESDLN